MSAVKKSILSLIILIFPVGLISYYAAVLRKASALASSAPTEPDAALKRESQELAALDLKLATIEGEILKHQSQRDAAVKSLELMREQIGALLNEANRGTGAQSP